MSIGNEIDYEELEQIMYDLLFTINENIVGPMIKEVSDSLSNTLTKQNIKDMINEIETNKL